MPTLNVQCIYPDAQIPTRAYPTDSGLDLYAQDDGWIEPKSSLAVSTGIAIQLPDGFEGQLRPRSGLAFKHDIFVHWGTIDEGFTGEIFVKMFNFGDIPFVFRKGDRIAQLVIMPVTQNITVNGCGFVGIRDKGRADAGFGSTGR